MEDNCCITLGGTKFRKVESLDQLFRNRCGCWGYWDIWDLSIMLLYYSYLPVKHSTVNSQASHSSLCADSLCHLAPIYGEEVYYRLGQVCFFFPKEDWNEKGQAPASGQPLMRDHLNQ